MSRSRLSALGRVGSLVLCAACEGAPPEDSRTEAPRLSDAAVELVTEEWEPGPCEGPGFELERERALGTLSLTIVGPNDEPLEGVWAQACTSTLCLPKVGTTDGAGFVSIGSVTGAPISGASATVEYGDGIEYTRWAMSPARDSGDLGVHRGFLLPPLAESAPFPAVDAERRTTAAGWVHSPELHLFLPEGTYLGISRLDYPDEPARGLRALPIPLDAAPAGVDASLGFELVLSATPSRSHFCPPARLVVPNTPGWGADTAVEIFVQALDPPSFDALSGKWSQGWAKGPAGWGKVADGVVTRDEMLIVATKGGIPLLTNIGIRRSRSP